MKTLRLGVLAVIAATAVACGKGPDSSSTTRVTGTVDGRTLDNASAIAVGSDGRTFSAYIQRSGRFTLDLPVGHVYRIVIANHTARGELRTIGHITNQTSRGTAHVLAIHDGGSLSLGHVFPAGSATLHTACACGSTGGSGSGDADKGSGDHGDTDKGDKDKADKDKDKADKDDKDDDGGDDYKCKEKDDDKSKVCDDDDDVDLESDHAPGDKCAKEDGDEDEPTTEKKSCSTHDKDHDGKDHDDKGDKDKGDGDKGGGGYGGSSSGGSSSGGSSSGGDTSGGGAGSCNCSTQCAAGSSCVASKCQPDAPPASSSSSSSGSTPPR